MKPVSLYHRLEALGIDQDCSFVDLWRASCFQSIRRYRNQDASPEDLQRVQSLGRGYVLRIAIAMVLGAAILTGGLSLILGYLHHVFIPTFAAISAISAVGGVLAALALRTIIGSECWPVIDIIAFIIPGILVLIGEKISGAPITGPNFFFLWVPACVVATVLTAASLRNSDRLFPTPMSDEKKAKYEMFFGITRVFIILIVVNHPHNFGIIVVLFLYAAILFSCKDELFASTERSLPVPILLAVVAGILFFQALAHESTDRNEAFVPFASVLVIALIVFPINIILHMRLPLYPIEVSGRS